jgi:hypothetical protein
MKKFLKNIFKFIAISIPIYLFLLILVGEFAPSFLIKNLVYKKGGTGFMDKRLEEANKKKDIDILFIGSSHAYRGFDPRIFAKQGYSSFNLGSSAQTPIETKFLLDKYITGLNPKYVIVDVYPSILSNDGTESALDLISNSKIDSEIINFALGFKNIKVYNTLIFAYYKQLLGNSKKNSYKNIPKTDRYITGGFVESFKKYSSNSKSNKIVNEIQPSPEQLQKLDEIIKIFNSRKIKFLLVQTPISQLKYNSFKNNSSIDSILHKKGHYINFNEILKLNDSLFIDDHHLNQYGVAVYNEELIKLAMDMLTSPSQIAKK